MTDIVALVRVRGSTHVKPHIVDALKTMGLTRKNHATLMIKDDSSKGVISKVNDYVAWGEVDAKTIESLIRSRGRISGVKPLTEEYVRENSGYNGIADLAKAISEGKATLKDVKGLKRVFRLNPPLKGFERGGIKKPYTLGGALGYRANKMNELISRMI